MLPDSVQDAASLFLHLSKSVVPHGWEAEHYGPLLRAEGFTEDGHGNWSLRIGDTSSAFMCHLDTVGRTPEPIVVRIDEKEGTCCTDGNTVLGADDRAGLAIILWMVRHQVPGLYYLFVGEEVGCVGSRLAACDPSLWEGIQRAVSFDRMGYKSIITHQCGYRTASEEFANALAAAGAKFGMEWAPDDTGVFTDSEVFKDLIPECTNVSVGYGSQHSNSEWQDLLYLALMADVCCSIDWEGLPTARVPGIQEEIDRWADYGDEKEDDWIARLKGSVTRGSSVFDTGFSAFDRVELALELGERIDADDLQQCAFENPDELSALLYSYTRTTRR
jgi:hypothetical protein